jgi:hypothetical protein
MGSVSGKRGNDLRRWDTLCRLVSESSLVFVVQYSSCMPVAVHKTYL